MLRLNQPQWIGFAYGTRPLFPALIETRPVALAAIRIESLSAPERTGAKVFASLTTLSADLLAASVISLLGTPTFCNALVTERSPLTLTPVCSIGLRGYDLHAVVDVLSWVMHSVVYSESYREGRGVVAGKG